MWTSAWRSRSRRSRWLRGMVGYRIIRRERLTLIITEMFKIRVSSERSTYSDRQQDETALKHIVAISLSRYPRAAGAHRRRAVGSWSD